MNFNLKLIDLFFVIFGALMIAFGSGNPYHYIGITMIAFGGALIGAALAFMGVRITKAGKKR